MQPISIDNPAWFTTYPHWMAPYPNEWLAGLLLRCDEANHWEAGTSMAHIRRTCSHSQDSFNIIMPSLLYLEQASLHLALPLPTLVATTYRSEVNRISEAPHTFPIQPLTRLRLALCPKCVQRRRLLSRTLLLPHITICPQHHLTFQQTCQCGAPLQLFSQQAPPFQCPACSLDWNLLPHHKASQADIAVERRLLSYYEFFFSQGTADVVASALQLIREREMVKGSGDTFFLLRDMKRYRYVGRSFYRDHSLGYVVYALARFNISPQKIMNYEAKEQETPPDLVVREQGPSRVKERYKK